MKRIDKSVASQIENTQHETTGAVTAQVENMQAAWTDAWNQQLSRSGEIYGRLFAGMRDELTTFWQKRLDANMQTARAWSACSSVNEALELQQSWLRSAIEHYSDESTRISELCRSAVFHAEPETAQHTPEEAKTAPERKPAHETHAPHIQRAAE
jgi:hypothetical protein